MRKLLSFGLVSLLIGITTATARGAQDGGGNDSFRDRLVGAWRLASLEQEGADEKTHTSDSTGLLVFTRDGHMSVQVMDRNPDRKSVV